MQVFFDNTIFHQQKYGGISRYICELATSIAIHCNIKVIVFGGYTCNTYLPNMLKHERLELIYVPRKENLRINTAINILSCIWRRIIFLSKLRNDPETIYHPTFFFIDTLLKHKAKATVITVHDMIPELYPDNSKHSQQHIYAKRHTMSVADSLVAVSNSTKKDIVRFYPEYSRKSIVVHSATNIHNSNIHSPYPDKHKNLITRKRFFIYIGNRGGYKNGIEMLKAFHIFAETHPNVSLILCGGESLNRHEKKLLQSHISTGNVSHVYPDDVSIYYYLQHAIALIYPSKYEGFGFPVLEALQSGCPVIATRTSSIPEIGGDAISYVASPISEKIVEKMEALLLDEEMREKCIKKGLLQAKRFSWEKTALRTTEIYRRAIIANRVCSD